MPVTNKGAARSSKYSRSPRFTIFRQLHRDIYRKLRQVSGSTVTHKRTAAFFCSGAEEIASALKVLLEISSFAQEQVPRVVFEVSVVCSDCAPPPDKSKDNPGTGVPAPDPVFLLELDHLFDFANRSGRRRARRVRHENSPTSPILRDTRNWVRTNKRASLLPADGFASPHQSNFRIMVQTVPFVIKPVRISIDPMNH